MSKRTGIMLAYNLEGREHQVERWPYVLAQPKLDGIRAVAYTGPGARLVSSQGNEFHSAPHIVSALARMPKAKLDGELLVEGVLFQETASFVKRDTPRADHTLIRYHVFDAVSEDNQWDRIAMLIGWLELYMPPHLVMVSTQACLDLKVAMRWLSTWLAQGYEGIILRNPHGLYVEKRSADLLKYKPTKTLKADIRMVEEEISIHGEHKGTLGSLVCMTNDGVMFSVGTGPVLTHSFRRDAWQDRDMVLSKIAIVKYQELTRDRKPRFPVLMNIE